MSAHSTTCTSSWAALFDQADNLSTYTDRGIQFVDRYGSFVKDRIKVEQDYAKAIRSLVDKYSSVKSSRSLTSSKSDEPEYTYVIAFAGVLSELGCVAGQHEVVAETLKDRVLTNIGEAVRELKAQRKTQLADLQRLDEQLKYRMDELSLAHREYHRAYKSSEDADMKYHKAEENMQLSRLDVQKAKEHAYRKRVEADGKKQEYAARVEKTNEHQRAHYRTLLPQTLESMRVNDEQRIERIQGCLQQMSEVERSVLPLIHRCYDGMAEHASRISPGGDTRLVAERLTSGYLPPEDIQMDDLARHPTSDTSSTGTGDHYQQTNGSASAAAATIIQKAGGTIGRSKSKLLRNLLPKHYATPSGVDGDDGCDLPPQQRVNRLESRLSAAESDLNTKTSEREGLLKMQKLYEEHPNMGDLQLVRKRLSANAEDIERVQRDIGKLRSILQDARSRLNVPINQARTATIPSSPGGAIDRRSTGRRSYTSSDDGASSYASGHGSSLASGHGIVTTSPPARPPLPLNGGNSPRRTEPPRGPIATRTPPSQMTDSGHYNEPIESPSVVLGIAKALYNFDGCSDNTIAMREGEEVQVTETDDGDGWSRIRRLHNGDEGFVPTSYLDVMLYPES